MFLFQIILKKSTSVNKLVVAIAAICNKQHKNNTMNPHLKFRMTVDEMFEAFSYDHPEYIANIQQVGRYAKRQGYSKIHQKVRGVQMIFYVNYSMRPEK